MDESWALLTPEYLWLLVGLPILWWWLLDQPSDFRSTIFPPLTLLKGLRQSQSNQAPHWLSIIIRLSAFTCLIIALAGPVLRLESLVNINLAQAVNNSRNDVLLVVDNDWSVGSDWQQRQQLIQAIITKAKHDNHRVYLMPSCQSKPIELAGATNGQSIVPQPWPCPATDQINTPDSIGTIIWLHNGLQQSGSLAQAVTDLARTLQITPIILGLKDKAMPSLLIDHPSRNDALRLIGPIQPVVFFDVDGHIIGRYDPKVSGQDQSHRSTKDSITIPLEIENTARVVIENQHQAGATFILDDRHYQRRVGLIAQNFNAPSLLLDSNHYLSKALAFFTDPMIAPFGTLIADNVQTIILTDGVLNNPDMAQAWVENGGVLIRFAGPKIRGQDDGLLPLPLQPMEHQLAGTLDWEQPATIDSFAFPLDDLESEKTAQKITIRRMILPRKVNDAKVQTWANLSDGSPLISALPRGQGWIILIHTAATPTWSDLPLSESFIDILERLTRLSTLQPAAPSSAPLSEIGQALFFLDGFGQPVDAHDQAIKTQDPIGPTHPPGLYSNGRRKLAFNLGPMVDPPKSTDMPLLTIDPQDWSRDQSWAWLFIMIAFLCVIVDSWRTRAAVRIAPILIGIASSLFAHPAQAGFGTDSKTDIHIAYIKSTSSKQNTISQQGLKNLSRIIGRRTTANIGAPVAITDLTDQSLNLYPVVYWPIVGPKPTLNRSQKNHLHRYRQRGGLLVIDILNKTIADPSSLDKALGLGPLQLLSRQHGLTRSFYLLTSLAGQNDGLVWTDSQRIDETQDDTVASLIVTANDWSGAWAQKLASQSQQESAWRSGINIIIYALTGDYKTDQIHLPTLLNRLQNQE